jgi:hypothetical protein
MAAMSDYLEQQLRTHIFRTGSFTKPSGLFVALCTAATSDSSTGSTITEPSGNGYSRQALAPSDSNWTAASSTDGLTDNASALTWTASGGNWGTITHVAICDASTAGSVLFHGALTASKTVNDGDSFQFAIGALDITFA